jgi:putative nucleotidyltransferase with HDIG domain
MTTPLKAQIRERVQQIETMPAIPTVFLPLLKLMSSSVEDVKLDEVVRLVSYDGALAAQCLRMAASPLFGMAQPPKSIKAAVISLGLRRVQTILLTCCLGQAFPTTNWALDPAVFWRHSLGCAMVCRKFSEKLTGDDHEKAYTAGLLHDIGFVVNCLAFPEEFEKAIKQAGREEIPLHEAERAVMGFTHCETGHALAVKWNLSKDIQEVIAHHHDHEVERSQAMRPLVALVHLSDLLCRMRDLGHGSYERQKVDLMADPAWDILVKEHRELESMDLVRFTFEMDDAIEEIRATVATIFGSAKAVARV